jgi:hypothetical protein
MAQISGTDPMGIDEEELADAPFEDDFAFDDDEDDLMERSQRKLIKAKLNKRPRGDW